MSVTNLREYRSRETVKLLTTLLAQAQDGKIDGLVFCVNLSTGRHAMGLSGSYLEDPVTALAVSSRLQHRLNQKIDEQRQNTDYPELKTEY